MPVTPAGTGSACACVAWSACGTQALAFRAPTSLISCADDGLPLPMLSVTGKGVLLPAVMRCPCAPWHRSAAPLRLYRPSASPQHGLSRGAASGLPGGRPWLVTSSLPLPTAACSLLVWELRMTALHGASSARSPAAALRRMAHALPPRSPPLAGGTPSAPSPPALAVAVAGLAAGPAPHPRASGRRPGAARRGAAPPGSSGASALRLISAATRGSTGREEAGT